MARIYHGWIIQFPDGAIFVQDRGSVSRKIGTGETAAKKAIEHFDQLAGQKVKLEDMGKLGLRVFTEGQ